MFAGLIVPRILVHHQTQTEYAAWVLILQLSAYVSLLDLGLQTIIAKLVAEYDAQGRHDENHAMFSSAFSLLVLAGALGLGVVAVLVWRVPHLFSQMPPALVPQVRTSLLLIGASLAVLLPFNPFVAVFTGLQEYRFPTLLASISRLASAAVIIGVVLLHGALVEMAAVMAVANLATAAAQYYGWKRLVSHRLRFSFFRIDRVETRRLMQSGGVIAIWTMGGFFVSGLDTVVVGHFDYAKTGFYAVAATATNFMVFTSGAIFGPLLPALSALHARGTPADVGRVTVRATRYCTLALMLMGLPLVVAGFPVLSAWVGPVYARQSLLFLQILVVANVIRNSTFPYSVAVVATGKQHLATFAVLCESPVNLIVSIFLARRIGAMGVALGTLIGASISVGVHFLVSMPRTHPSIEFSRWQFVKTGLMRPMVCALPLLLLIGHWRNSQPLPAQPAVLAAWFVLTALLAWFFGVDREDWKLVLARLHQLRRRESNIATSA